VALKSAAWSLLIRICESACFSSESLCGHRRAAFAGQTISYRSFTLVRTLAEAVSKEEISGKLWIVEIGRVRVYQEELD